MSKYIYIGKYYIILCTCAGIWIFRRRFQIRYFFKDALKGAKLAKLRGQGPDQSVKYSAKAPEYVKLVAGTDTVVEVTDDV